MNQIEIGGRLVGETCPVLVVAEIGNNHDGNLSKAKNLIDAAAEAKVDAVKLQSHIANEEMLPDSPVPGHFPEPRYQFIRRMEFSEEQHRELKSYAESKGLIFFSTPISRAAVDLLDRLEAPCFKVGSGDVTDLLLLTYIAQKRKPILLSTGMSSWSEIEQANAMIQNYGAPIILMQCTSIYPCPYDEVGLNLIPEMRRKFNVPIGLSDHTPTIYTAIASVALGACVIEKHFTLDKTLYGPDHAASLEPEELCQLVQGVRAVERALKPVDKDNTARFETARQVFQKSVISAANIEEGVVVTRTMVETKRPGTGISATKIDDVIGKKTLASIPANTMLKPGWLQ
jgi:N,N'-diacetyllegionaminate synthase